MSVAIASDNQPIPAPDDSRKAPPAVVPQGSATEAAASGRSGRRNENIDVVRAFAAAGIVFVHATEAPLFDRWGNLFRFGVPFFLFASLYFQSLSLVHKPDRTLGHFAIDRFKRLYVPFLVWSVIYLISRNIERIFLRHLGLVRLHPSMLISGTEYHLWFLPFLLGWSLVLAVIYKLILQHDRQWRWPLMILAILGGCAVACAPAPNMPAATEMTFDSPVYCFIQWTLALPAAFWAMAFAWFMTLGPQVYEVPTAFGWGGILLLVACSFQQVLHGIELAPRALTGLGTILPALSRASRPANAMLARLGRYGYGIYLCHVFPVEIVHMILHRYHPTPSPWLDVLNLCISFSAAWLIVHCLMKSRWTAWLAG
jgi:peptidoglycan/LPS O-acetylase OafA/YrhL